jgi:cell wall assembly regulator SMI1
MSELVEQWKRIVTWAERVAPEALELLSGPASPKGIAELEGAIGNRLPESYRTWLGIHDGERRGGRLLVERLLSAVEVAEKHRFRAEMRKVLQTDFSIPADPGVKPVWSNAAWIDFTEDGAGNALCFDLDPAPGGARGQIIHYIHDHEARRCVAVDFVDLLRQHAGALDRGDVVAVEYANGVDDGLFFTILHRESLTGDLADVLIRGETREQAHVRRARYLENNPFEAARRFVELAERNQCFPRLGLTPQKMFAIEAVKEVMTQNLAGAPLGRALHHALSTSLGLVRLGCSAEDLVRMLPVIAEPDRFSPAKGGGLPPMPRARNPLNEA